MDVLCLNEGCLSLNIQNLYGRAGILLWKQTQKKVMILLWLPQRNHDDQYVQPTSSIC